MAARPPTFPSWAAYLAQGKKLPNQRYLNRPPHALALADKVRRQPRELESPECITEMSLMMACWKQNEFRETDCAQETGTFLRCVSEAEAKRKEKMKQEQKGQAGQLDLKKVNQLLQQFPNIKRFS